jgi:hypothetical protein
MSYPVSGIDIAALFRQRKVNWEMPVSENKIIDRLLFKFPVAILNEPFILGSQEMLVAASGSFATGATEILCQADSQVGMQLAEHPLTYRMPKYFLESFVSMVSGA